MIKKNIMIEEYIPKRKEIIDRRSRDGGYYVASCDRCGERFYPIRNNAKYCSKSCQQMAWREKTEAENGTELLEIEETKTEVEETKTKPVKTGKKHVTGAKNVVTFLMENGVELRGNMGNAKSMLIESKIDTTSEIFGWFVRKLSVNRYEVWQVEG